MVTVILYPLVSSLTITVLHNSVTPLAVGSFLMQAVPVLKILGTWSWVLQRMELLENSVRDVREYRTWECPSRGHSQVVLWAQWCVTQIHWQPWEKIILDKPGKSLSLVADQLSKAAYQTSVFFPYWNSNLLYKFSVKHGMPLLKEVRVCYSAYCKIQWEHNLQPPCSSLVAFLV